MVELTKKASKDFVWKLQANTPLNIFILCGNKNNEIMKGDKENEQESCDTVLSSDGLHVGYEFVCTNSTNATSCAERFDRRAY